MRNVPQPDVPGSVVVVTPGGTQTPLVPGFVSLQSLTSRWHAFRAAACCLRQARFSAFDPAQLRLLGTAARQSTTSSWQSLRQ